MNTAIAIFVKTPGLSPIKTRLAAGIGENKALEFYKHSLAAVKATLEDVEAVPHWAIAEEQGVDQWPDFKALWTGEGVLGTRQHHIYETIRSGYNKAILIGADAPQLSPKIIEQAIAALNDHDFVIGPARDGGYYLFGGRVSLAQHIWTGIEYSQPTTRAHLIEKLPAAPAMLPALTDVDMQEDLAAVITEMPTQPSAAQQALIDWIKSL